MITAQNYAAQAERGLRHMADVFRKRLGEKYLLDAIGAAWLADQIKNSVHFAIPDNGRLFEDDLRGLIGMEARLPFKRLTLEYFAEEDKIRYPEAPVYAPKRVIFAVECNSSEIMGIDPDFPQDGNGEIDTLGVWAVQEAGNIWYPCAIGWAMPIAWDKDLPDPNKSPQPIFARADGLRVSGRPIALSPGMASDLFLKLGEEKALQMLFHDISLEISAVLNFCEAFTCSNVRSTVLAEGASDKKNARRICEGRLPFYETKTLTVAVPGSSQGTGKGKGGDRNGPRQHLRRGHIRRLADNRRIWVNSCVVGSKVHGTIEKNYQVTRGL